ESRDERRSVANNEDTVDGLTCGALQDCGDRRFFVVVADWNRAVTPRIFEHITAIGREDQFDTEALCSLPKHAGLITGCGGEQKDALFQGRGHRADGKELRLI